VGRSSNYSLLSSELITFNSNRVQDPEEVWKGHPCNYSNLKFFGCEAYALILKHQRSKLDSKSKRIIFVGYGDGIKGYRLWDPTAHKITINRDIIFDESSLIKSDVDVQMKHEEVPKYQ
jgi:hypothetical protein